MITVDKIDVVDGDLESCNILVLELLIVYLV